MTNVAIIPARGGSRRIPRKNIRDFHGKPIIAYSIVAAIASGLFSKVWVSTDDEEISRVAMLYGAEVHWRSEAMARDCVGTQEVTAYVARELDIFDDYLCCIYPTAPLMALEDLERGLYMMRQYCAHYAVGVGAQPLRDAGQFYWMRTESVRARAPLYRAPTISVAIDESRVCDINTEADWKRAEQMYIALIEQSNVDMLNNTPRY